MKKLTIYKSITIASLLLLLVISPVYAQKPTLNPFSPDFKLSICDGPRLPPGVTPPKTPYVECDFPAFIAQVQFLIEAMIVLGTLAAIISLTYAGVLYMSGQKGKIDQARDMFKKTGIGFLMMLTAWFVVYQLLDWLAANPGVKAILGA